MEVSPPKKPLLLIAELMQWEKVPKGLEGKIVNNVHTLKELIPPDNQLGEVVLRVTEYDPAMRSPVFIPGLVPVVIPGFKRYSRADQNPELGRKPEDSYGSVDVAYSCPGKCNGIVIGPPKIECKYDDMEFYCVNCDFPLMIKHKKRAAR